MISYQKPTVAALDVASEAIQGQGKLTMIVPDADLRPTSGHAYDLDE